MGTKSSQIKVPLPSRFQYYWQVT